MDVPDCAVEMAQAMSKTIRWSELLGRFSKQGGSMTHVLRSLLVALLLTWAPAAVEANGLAGGILWSAEGRHEARPRSSSPLLLGSPDIALLAASGSSEDPSRIWRIDPNGPSAVEAQALEFPSGIAGVSAARRCADGRTLFIARPNSSVLGDSVGQLAVDGTLRWIRSVADVPALVNNTLHVSGTCDAIVSGEVGSGVLQVWALDAETGVPRWARDLRAGPETASLVPMAVAFATPDAVFIRVGSSTALTKLDAATGVVQWTRQYPGDTVLGRRSCPVATADGGRGYFGCRRFDDTPAGGPAIVSIDASTGDIVWTTYDAGEGAFGGSTPIDVAVEDGITLRIGARIWRVEPIDGATRWATSLRFNAAVSQIPGGDVLIAEPSDGADPAQLSRRSTDTGAILWTRVLSSTFIHSVSWAGSHAVVLSLDRINGLLQFTYPDLALFNLVDGSPTGELQPTASVSDRVGVPVAVGADYVVARTTLAAGTAQLLVERRHGTTGTVQWSRALPWESAVFNQGLTAPTIALDASGVLSIATSTYPRFTDSAGARLQSSFVVAIAASDGTIIGQLAMPPVSSSSETRWFAVQQAQFLAPDGFVMAGTEGRFDGNTAAITRQSVIKRRDVGATVDRWTTRPGSFLVEDGAVIVFDTDASQPVRWRRLDRDTGGVVWERTGVGSSPLFSLLRRTGSGDIVATYSARFSGFSTSYSVGMTRFSASNGAATWDRQWAYQPTQQEYAVNLQVDSFNTALLSVRGVGAYPTPLLWRFDTVTGNRVYESTEAVPAEWAGSGGRIVRRSGSEIAMAYARWANATQQPTVCGACASALRVLAAETGAAIGAHFTSNAGRLEQGTADTPPAFAESGQGPDAALRTAYDPVLGRRELASALLRPASPTVGNASVQIDSFDVLDDPYATATVAVRIDFTGSAEPTRIELRSFQQAGSWITSVTCAAPRNSCQLDPQAENLSGSVELAGGESAQLLVSIRQNPNSGGRGPFSIAVAPPFAMVDDAPQNNFASVVLPVALLKDSFESP
jgi:outer membrane protein assembly factor BamB